MIIVVCKIRDIKSGGIFLQMLFTSNEKNGTKHLHIEGIHIIAIVYHTMAICDIYNLPFHFYNQWQFEIFIY